MRVILTYPVPFNCWDAYEPFVKRFTTSFKENPPGCDYELLATNHWGEPIDEVRKMFYGIKANFFDYNEDGCQIGAQLQVAKFLDSALDADVFLVGFTTHAYFHRPGWLKRLVDCRAAWGPGLYGVCASREGGKLHLRTSCYGADLTFFTKYPKEIQSREDCNRFEHGEWCFSEWCDNQGYEPKVAHWDAITSLSERVTNGYRNGNQEQLLVWDRHTDLYQNASPEEKARYTALAWPG